MIIINRVLILVFFLLFTNVASAQDDAPRLFIDGQLDAVNLTYYSQRLLDDSASLTYQQVVRQHSSFEPVLDPQQLHLGYYEGAMWLRHDITNTSDKPLVKILSFDYANIDRVHLYLFDGSGTLVSEALSGSHQSRAQRPLNNRHASFPIPIAAESSVTVLSRITSNGSMTAYHHLYSAEEYNDSYNRELLWLSIYCGMLLALGLYNLLLFMALREPVFLHYSLFATSFLMGTLAMNGLGVQFFWDHNTLDVNRVMAFSFAAAGFTGTLFVRRFLNLQRYAPHWQKLTYIPLAVAAAGIVSALISSPQLALKISDINGITAGVVLLSCGIYCWYKRVPGAQLFVIAWTLLLTGAFIHALRNLGVLPTNFISLYGMQLGSAIEMLLLSFAIAAKFNQLKQEKQRAQNDALMLLKTNETQLQQQLEQRNYELQQMAQTDGLTGLLNRTGISHALQAALTRCQHNRQPITLFLLDLDAFKPINDSYGHYIGDRILESVAQRLQQCLQGYDSAGRFGGDEFIVICESLNDSADAEKFSHYLCYQIARPMAVGLKRDMTLSASIGYFQGAADTSVNTLLKEADKAMSRVQYQQRGKCLRY